MNTDLTSKETYDRLSKILGKPDEYLNGKICNYHQLDQIDREFLSNLDKEYISDYFLIKDWVDFSFYRGSLIPKLINENYKDIPLNNIKLIWNAFNKNKQEKDGKSKDYFHEKRYFHIPDIASLLLKKAKTYNQKELLILLKEIISNLSEEMDEYYLARNTAKLLGDYFLYNKEINKEIFEFMKEQQKLDYLDIGLIFYDFNIIKISNEVKIEEILKTIKELKPIVTNQDIIKEAIKNKSHSVIKFIYYKYNYKFEEKEIHDILLLHKEKGFFPNAEIIEVFENFQPVEFIKKSFDIIYKDFKYNTEEYKREFYRNYNDYLTKKIPHDKMNEKFVPKEIKNKINKI